MTSKSVNKPQITATMTDIQMIFPSGKLLFLNLQWPQLHMSNKRIYRLNSLLPSFHDQVHKIMQRNRSFLSVRAHCLFLAPVWMMKTVMTKRVRATRNGSSCTQHAHPLICAFVML